MKRTFKKGVHPNPNKGATQNLAIEVMQKPEQVHISTSMHIGKSAKVCVNVGDKVSKGQLIAEKDGFVSANIYSSVSGEVVKIDELRETVMGKATHIVIKNDGEENAVSFEPIKNADKEQILKRIELAGIVGMGGAGFPTHVKLSPKEKIDTFIINSAECEPYITCDHRIMLEYTEKVVKGALLMAKAIGLDSVYFGIEENKQNAIDAINEYCKTNSIAGVKVVKLKAKYPQGAEKQLIYAITRRKVPVGALPSTVGCVVDNVHTAYAVYEAVEEGKPLYERIMTVTGDGVTNPKNLKVAFGTLFEDIINYCGREEDVEKLISGGPMMGITVHTTQCATGKTSSCLLLLSSKSANTSMPDQCINCSKCASVCPMRLMPMFIDSALASGDLEQTKALNVMACMECGSCAYVCPAHRPLVQTMKLAKKKLREMK